MLELKLYQNNSSTSAQYGMWYPRVDYKEEYDVVKLAKHMAEHETPFSAGTIKGILMDAIKCIRHLCLEGKTVHSRRAEQGRHAHVDGQGCQPDCCRQGGCQ